MVTKQTVVDFLLHQAALPISLLMMWYSIATYRRGATRTKSGAVITRYRSPIRFWTEVAGGIAIAVALAITGTSYLI